MAESALIVGADSTLGRALGPLLAERGVAVTGTTRAMFDLAAPPSGWPELPAVDTAYLLAARGGLEACEADPHGTHLVNVEATVELARRLAARGAFVVFPSSNQVFDGETPYARFDHPTAPKNEYGRQKVAAETRLAAVLRLTKVVHDGWPLLVAWRAALARGEPIEAFDDLPLAPVTLAEAAAALARVGAARQPGTYQISGPRDVTYHELAVEVAGDPRPVRAVRARDHLPAIFLRRHATLAPRLP